VIVEFLQNIKKQVTAALGCPYKGTSHTTPDTSDCVWKVANKVKELGLYKFEIGREGNEMAKKTVNILSLGEKRLKSSTLATFNKKVQRLHEDISMMMRNWMLTRCRLQHCLWITTNR
jgi:hypothetical protein